MQEETNTIVQMRFPQKLWYLLNLRTGAILWGGTGRTILLNYRILYNYLQCDHSVFKTTHISSFIRQLNLYGFRKVTSHLQDPLCNSSNPFMHEYMHDCFQFGRPELLNKITRKALTMKKNFKSIYKTPQPLFMTPLQRARRALSRALEKAAENLLMKDSKNYLYNINFDGEDDDNFCDDEENEEFDWSLENNMKIDNHIETPNPGPCTEYPAPNITTKDLSIGGENIEQQHRPCSHNLVDYNVDLTQKNGSENYTMQFLSMPDLDPLPINKNQTVRHTDELKVNHDELTNDNLENNENDMNTLNCVLPSISNDQNEDVSMTEEGNITDHYHGEWEQMFNELITNKSATQESTSEFKDLYSQISKTIDLLNT